MLWVLRHHPQVVFALGIALGVVFQLRSGLCEHAGGTHAHDAGGCCSSRATSRITDSDSGSQDGRAARVACADAMDSATRWRPTTTAAACSSAICSRLQEQAAHGGTARADTTTAERPPACRATDTRGGRGGRRDCASDLLLLGDAAQR